MTSEQTLRTGVLFKKGSGTGPFGRRNWKPRYFVLTPRKLSYYTYEDGELKGEVDLSGCNEQSIEVMPADSMKTGSSASTIWRIAINAADRRLIVAAGTEMEMNDWVEQLLVAFHINNGQPPPQRRSIMQAPPSVPVPGVVTNPHVDPDFARNSITDFQNFAVARRSVGGAVRASLGAHAGHEFRLSDEHERQKHAEQQRMEEQRQLAEMEAERLREEELLQAHLRRQAEERWKQKEIAAHTIQHQEEEEKQHELEDIQRKEELLEEQRRLKREQHERDRLKAERMMREMELQEKAKQEQEKLEQEKLERAKYEQMKQEQMKLEQAKHEQLLLEQAELERVKQEKEVHHEVEVHRRFEEVHRVVEVHRREVVEHVPSSPVRSPIVTPPSAPSPPQRSSLIGDAKKEAMMRQQAEHNKRREAAIKEQQEQMRQEYMLQGARSPPRSPVKSQVEVHRPTTPVKSMSSVEF